METKFQTSFIPKKPVVQEIRTTSGISLFLLIAILIFIVSVGVAGWVFFEKGNLVKKIEENKDIIEVNKKAFETQTIESMLRLDSRIKVAGDLLSKHTAMSEVFEFLGARTLKNVRFKNFNFTISNIDSSASGVKVEMSGQAKDFRTVASQAEEFGRVEFRNIIREPEFSDLNLTQDGSVSFAFSAFIVPEFISYSSARDIIE